MNHFAPAGTPVTVRDIAAGLGASWTAAGVPLAESLVRGLPGHRAWLVSSGRAAMTLILRAMRDEIQDTRRNEVVVPAYTCYSVPAAVARAGLQVRLCDVNAKSLSMDTEALEKFDFSKVLAVITANLYGLPNELVGIEAVCKRNGVFLLDDAAQALGATIGGRAAGTFGDAGLYSFDRGKIISTMEGGAVLCRNADLVSRLEPTIFELPRSSALEASITAVKLLGYSIMLRPKLYGVVGKLPWLRLGQTVFETQYPISQLSKFQAVVALRLLSRLQSLNDSRRQRAAEYTNALRDLPGIALIPPLPGATAAYARYPFRVATANDRLRVLAALNSAGIGATPSYPCSLVDVRELRSTLAPGHLDCPGAREVASSIVTLPTHAYVDSSLAPTVRALLKRCLS